MAITPLIQEYIVDFASNNNFFFVNAVQGDGHDVRYVQLSLTNNGQPYTIPTDGSATIVIRGKTPNGDQYLDTESGEIIDNSTILFELKQSMIWYAGKGKFEVCVVSNSSNQLLTSFPFYVCVAESGFDTRGITEQPEFINLVQVLGTVNDAVNDCNKATENANVALGKADDALGKADDALKNATEALEKAKNAKSDGDYAREWGTAAEQAVKDIQNGLAINDNSYTSRTTGWSAYQINKELNRHLFYHIDGTVEVNNIPDLLIAGNDEDDSISMFSPNMNVEETDENISIDYENLTVTDDGNGNVEMEVYNNVYG